MGRNKKRRKAQSSRSKNRHHKNTDLVPKYTEEEKTILNGYKEKCKSKQKPLEYRSERSKDGRVILTPTVKEELVDAFRAMTAGAVQPNSAKRLIDQAIAASMDSNEKWDIERGEAALNAILEMMTEFAPQNGTEGMLVTQIVSVHNQAMQCLNKANHPLENEANAAVYRKRAIDFMKLFMKQIEFLERLRGKAQQTVTVKHVNVNQGGQAIVGNVNPHPTHTDK
jgi:hypothetical protein